MSQRVNRYYLVSALSQPEATRSSGLSFLPALPVEEGRHTQGKDKLSVTSQTVKFTMGKGQVEGAASWRHLGEIAQEAQTAARPPQRLGAGAGLEGCRRQLDC